MADSVARPTFYEGEILPAADLIAAVDAARGQMARHQRYLHRWGIAAGLELQGVKATTATGVEYKNVTLKAGISADGSGREIVVPEDVPLNPTDFQSQINGKPGIWYPVFLLGRDENAPPLSNLTGACQDTQPTRIQENYDVTYGNPGSELNLDQQTAPDFADGPADGVALEAWRVLLGFVQWNPTISKFSDVAELSPDSGIGRRYVGVNAADVISGSGALRLASHPVNFTGPDAVMALEIHERNEGELIFGKQNPDGTLAPVLTISSKGDLTAAGKVTGAVTPGSVQVQSGVAFDGLILPLPVGIDPTAVTAGKVTLHIHVTPRFDQLQPPAAPAGPWIPSPYECRVDSDTRQVHCRMQWWRGNAVPLTAGPILPALCDYTIIAAVAASS